MVDGLIPWIDPSQHRHLNAVFNRRMRCVYGLKWLWMGQRHTNARVPRYWSHWVTKQHPKSDCSEWRQRKTEQQYSPRIKLIQIQIQIKSEVSENA